MPSARKPAPTPEPWMSLGDAARALGITRHTTLARIVKGELIGQHVGGQTFVRRDTVEARAELDRRHKARAS